MKNRISPMRDRHEVVLIGPFPPPYGGISVHLNRLISYLKQTKFNYILYNTFSESECEKSVISVRKNRLLWYIKFAFFHRSQIVHLHSPNWIARLIFAIMARLRSGKYIISIQGRSISEASKNSFSTRGRLTVWMLKQMDTIIACNDEIKKECINRIGISKDKVHMVPAYIPPLPSDLKKPPANILDFIQSHSPVICATGWIGQKFNGDDIYGIDMLISLIDRLLPDFPGIGLILSVNGGESADAINQTIANAKSLVGDHIAFVTEQLDDIVGLYQECDLFCRPTNTDGDAVSIREAIHVGTPVVASDAAPRPVPCILFKSRDIVQFENVVRQVLGNLDFYRKKTTFSDYSNNAQKIIKLYTKLLMDGESCRC